MSLLPQPPRPPRRHHLSAEFASTPTDSSSTSAATTLTVDAGASTVSLSPSATHAGPGQTVTFTVDVAALAPATGTPTGTVTIYDGANPVATAPLATGTVSIPVDTLPSGAQSITASYTGDGNFDPSTSAATTVTIT